MVLLTVVFSASLGEENGVKIASVVKLRETDWLKHYARVAETKGLFF